MSLRCEHDDFDRCGFAMVRSVVSTTLCQALIAELGPVSRAGRRGILAIPVVEQLAHSAELLAHIRSYVAGDVFPVRGIYFDKSSESNWLVAWH